MSVSMLAKLCRGIADGLADALAPARRMMTQLKRELARLNRARLTRAELERISRRERARIVKRALAEHHRGTSRCC